MQYVRVKPGTEAWGYFDLYWNQQKYWLEHKERIEATLGFPMDQCLVLDVRRLAVHKIPTGFESSFSKTTSRGVYWAHTNSKLNKAWLELAKELKLRAITSGEICMFLSLNSRNLDYPKTDTWFPKMSNEYYIQGETSERWKAPRYDWAELVPEEEFLRVRMKWLQENPVKEGTA